MDDFNFSRLVYKYHPLKAPKAVREVEAIGFDSEADRNGRTFLYCLSTGDYFTPDNLLSGLFSRKYRGKHFVVYNLKYEQGAILKRLPSRSLDELRVEGKTTVGKYTYNVVGYKCLRISRGKNTVTFWDMYTFYHMSLASAARHFTRLRKLDLDVEAFTPEYIAQNFERIKQYCVQDAVITAELFRVLKGMCSRLGIKPTTFYSIATIGFKYARENTDYVTVKRLWDYDRDVLEAACQAYNGGKFEVTTRGRGHFYEYDINSAYPFEIANLVDISRAKVTREKSYQPRSTYGFVLVDCWLTEDETHPVAYRKGMINVYPCGHFEKWVTKAEYEYLRTLPGASVTIRKAVWLWARTKRRPYLAMIKKLYRVKAEAKVKGDQELYHFTKILMNSLYGKMVQLIKRKGVIEASTCWNPVYGAIITANTRLRVTELQRQYPQVVAVHTDSVISSEPLPLKTSAELGEWDLAVYGLGIIIGTGFYQIGDKVRVRGFPFQTSLFDLLNKSPPLVHIPDKRAVTWRQVAAFHWWHGLINRFQQADKVLNINFDTKRIWPVDWTDGDDALDRVIPSTPYLVF